MMLDLFSSSSKFYHACSASFATSVCHLLLFLVFFNDISITYKIKNKKRRLSWVESFYPFDYASVQLTYPFMELTKIPFPLVLVKDAFATGACT